MIFQKLPLEKYSNQSNFAREGSVFISDLVKQNSLPQAQWTIRNALTWDGLSYGMHPRFRFGFTVSTVANSGISDSKHIDVLLVFKLPKGVYADMFELEVCLI